MTNVGREIAPPQVCRKALLLMGTLSSFAKVLEDATQRLKEFHGREKADERTGRS